MKSVGKYFSIVIVVFALGMTEFIWVNNNENSTVDAIVIDTPIDPIDEVDDTESASPIIEVVDEIMDNTEANTEEEAGVATPIIRDKGELEKPLVNVEVSKEPVPSAKEEVKPEASEFKVVVVRQRIAYTTSYLEDSSLKEGERIVKTKGIDGFKTITCEREYKANKLIGEKILSQSISQEVINEVVLVGVKKEAQATELREFARDSFNKQNEYRNSKGVSELVWDENLYRSVLIRANELTVKFSHTRPDGSSPFSVITISCNGAAENIALKATSSSNIGHTFSDVWINSKGHHDNLINAKYSKAAVAIVEVNGIYFAVTIYVG